MAFIVFTKNQIPPPSILFILIALFALPVTFYALQTQQNIVQHASEITPIYLVPSSETVAPGDKLAVALEVKTANAPIKEVQVNIKYPSDKLSDPEVSYENSPFKVTNEQVIGQGFIRIGRDATIPVAGYNQIASLHFTAKDTFALSEISLAPGSYVISNANKSFPVNLIIADASYYKDNLPPNTKIFDQLFDILITIRSGIASHIPHF